jgi:hypothetical protein
LQKELTLPLDLSRAGVQVDQIVIGIVIGTGSSPAGRSRFSTTGRPHDVTAKWWGRWCVPLRIGQVDVKPVIDSLGVGGVPVSCFKVEAETLDVGSLICLELFPVKQVKLGPGEAGSDRWDGRCSAGESLKRPGSSCA